MYDSLLIAGKGEKVRMGEDIHLFLRRCVAPPYALGRARVFGCRIQDFRYEGLAGRVKEEEERLEEMRADLEDVREKRVVDPEKAGEGYVRLPLFNGSSASIDVIENSERRKGSLYPSLPPMQCRFNRS